MRNIAAAAIPLAIALLGTATGNIGTDIETHTRVAVTASNQPLITAGLTDDQEAMVDFHNPFGIPRTEFPGNRTLVVRTGYTLAHNNVDLIADWVSFQLTRHFVNGIEQRPGSSAFKPDPLLSAGSRAELDDYKGWKGIYDRGHQVASGDSKGRGKTVIRESFYLSNITPQDSRLNQNKWRLLEDRIQKAAAEKGNLWVVTGPVFVDDDGDGLVEFSVIGSNEIAVPTHYYKIVLAEQGESDGHEAMAFLVPNEAINRPGEDIGSVMGDFLTSIDEIERLTGFDFFPGMDDAQEDELERLIADEVWVPD